MKKIDRILVLIVFFSIIFLLSNVVCASSSLIEKVKEESTPITSDDGTLSKKITNLNQATNEITIQLNFKSQDSKAIKENTEIIFLMDNSTSMNTGVGSTAVSRKRKVINSTKELINNISKNNANTKMGVISFSSSANVLQNLTNNKEQLLNACDNFAKQSASGDTNMIAGINLAKSSFTASANNKILILLTDGLPSSNGQAVKNSLKDEKVYIITTLVGLENAKDTEKATINDIFGSAENPVANKFYNISDSEIEQTIVNNIYDKIVEDFQSSITNINIQDYFPQEIIDNFDISTKNPSKGSVSKEKDYILWNIPEIKSSETVSLEYVLKLKEKYDKSIINKIIDTNKKVEFKYNDFKNNSQTKTMEDSPQIKVKENEIEDKKSENNNNILIGSDNTTANKVLSNAGSPKIILFILVIIISNIVILKFKMKDIIK